MESEAVVIFSCNLRVLNFKLSSGKRFSRRVNQKQNEEIYVLEIWEER